MPAVALCVFLRHGFVHLFKEGFDPGHQLGTVLLGGLAPHVDGVEVRLLITGQPDEIL